MSYKTDVVFGRRETVQIASPDFLSMAKVEIDIGDDVKIKAGEFVKYDGTKSTLTDKKEAHFLVIEDTFYNDMKSRNKPAGVVEGFFGEMLLRTKVFEEGGTAFAAGDKVTLVDGKIAHTSDTNKIVVGEVISRGTDWLAIAMG